MKKLLRSAAATAAVLGVSISPGIALANHTNDASISNTGFGSDNSVVTEHDSDVDVTNRTTLRATNNNPQTAVSGDVRVTRNTTSDGDAASGHASNDGLFSATATVNNNDCDCQPSAGGTASTSGTINQTGARSENHILFSSDSTVDVDNDTDISVTNNNTQTAVSGNVTVSENTTAGGATSGDASNISTTVVDFEVNN